MKLIHGLFLLTPFLLASCDQSLTTEQYLVRGDGYIQEEKLKSAIIEYKNAVKQSPEDAKARAKLGKAYIKGHNLTAAVKELKRALDLKYDKQLVIIDLARAYDQMNQSENILKEIEVDEKFSDTVKANIYAYRAKALIRQGRLEDARINLAKGRKLNEDLIETRLAWALYEKAIGNVAAQKKWLSPLLKQNEIIADAWSQWGEIEQSENNFDLAEEAFTKAILSRGVVSMDYVRRSLLRISMQKYELAQEDLTVLNKAGIKWPVVSHAEGVIALQQKEYEKAQGLFEKALVNNPNYAPSKLLLGMVHFHRSNFQNAVKYFEQYLSVLPDSNQANFFYAASLLRLGQTDNAIEILEMLNIKTPDDSKVLALLGATYVSNKKVAQGVSLLKQAVALSPDQASLRLQLGSVLLNSKESVLQGRKEVEKSIELDPESEPAYIALYKSYIQSGEFDSAREVANQLAKRKESTSTGFNLYALSFLAQKSTADAIEQFNLVLEKFPNDATASNNLANIYIQKNQLDKAKVLLHSVLTEDKGHLPTIQKLAFISAREKKPEDVLKWLKKASDLNPNVLAARLQLASQYLRQNEYNTALDVLQNADNSQKQSPNFILLMARVKLGLKEYQHATRLLRALNSKNPGIPASYMLLAQAYGLQDDPKNMRKSLETVIKLSPDEVQPHLALAKLDLVEGNIKGFERRIKLLIVKYPENRDVKFLHAKADTENKNYDGAISTLSQLMTVSPHQNLVIDLANNQWQSGDRENAIAGLELWIHDNKEDTRALMLLAQFYQQNKRKKEAVQTYKKLNELKPGNLIVLNNLAWLLKDSDPVKGLDFAKQALTLDSESPYVQDTLSILFLKNNDLESALKYSEEAAKTTPGIFDIQINYAKILNANKKGEKAKQVLSSLYKEVKTDEHRLQIENELDNLD